MNGTQFLGEVTQVARKGLQEISSLVSSTGETTRLYLDPTIKRKFGEHNLIHDTWQNIGSTISNAIQKNPNLETTTKHMNLKNTANLANLRFHPVSGWFMDLGKIFTKEGKEHMFAPISIPLGKEVDGLFGAVSRLKRLTPEKMNAHWQDTSQKILDTLSTHIKVNGWN